MEADKEKLLPTTMKDGQTTDKRFRISMARLLLIGFAFPPFALGYFLLNTILTDFKESTYTHCDVLNVIPSLSAVAKSQQNSWQLITWLHFPFRLLAAFLYWRYYQRKLPSHVRSFGCLAVMFLIQESLSTVVLAQWAHINGKQTLHIFTAASLWLSGICFMGTSFVCFKYYRRDLMETMEELSYLIKKRLLLTYYCTTVIMWFWYLVHNGLCLPFAYSVFSLCEYVVTWTFMAYMGTAYFDFHQVYLLHHPQLGYFLSEF